MDNCHKHSLGTKERDPNNRFSQIYGSPRLYTQFIIVGSNGVQEMELLTSMISAMIQFLLLTRKIFWFNEVSRQNEKRGSRMNIELTMISVVRHVLNAYFYLFLK